MLDMRINKNASVQLAVPPDAKAAIEGAAKAEGMTKVEFMRRVFMWTARQEPSVRKLILGTLDDDQELHGVAIEKMRKSFESQRVEPIKPRKTA